MNMLVVDFEGFFVASCDGQMSNVPHHVLFFSRREILHPRKKQQKQKQQKKTRHKKNTNKQNTKHKHLDHQYNK